jgi:transposase
MAGKGLLRRARGDGQPVTWTRPGRRWPLGPSTRRRTGKRAALLKVMLERIDWINAGIARLSQVIEGLLAPYEEQLQQAESRPGWGRRAAEDVIAETGADMSRSAAGAHLASWAGRTPLDHQSGARPGKARRKHGNRYLGAVTGETAVAAGKADTREGARHRRLVRTRGKAKACAAAGNTPMRVFRALLSRPGTRYEDLGASWHDSERQAARRVSRHVGALGAMGYEVTLCRKPQPGEPAPQPDRHRPQPTAQTAVGSKGMPG